MLTTLLFLVVAGVVGWLVSLILNMVSGTSEIASWFLTRINGGADPARTLEYLVRAVGWGRLILAFLVGGLVSSVVTCLWYNVMDAGYRSYCLAIVRGQEPLMSSAFSGFSHLGKILPTRLLTLIFTFLWDALFTVGLLVASVLSVVLLFKVSPSLCVLIIIAVSVLYTVGVIWVELRYSMVNFLIMDQGLSGTAAIRESKRLMKGNKGKLFCLYLSYIGWFFAAIGIFYAVMLVVLISVGIGAGMSSTLGRTDGMVGGVIAVFVVVILYLVGLFILMLWLKPYITGSVALFYDWTRGVNPAGPAFSGPSMGGPTMGPGSGWGAPGPQSQNYNYTWSDGSGGSGSGIGSGPQYGGPGAAGPQSGAGWGGEPSMADPRSGVNWNGEGGGSAPQPPRDDPWA